MDTTDPDIQFDENGICSNCRKYERRAQRDLHYDEAGQKRLEQLINEIKEKGEGKGFAAFSRQNGMLCNACHLPCTPSHPDRS